jgi:hypothetical protein
LIWVRFDKINLYYLSGTYGCGIKTAFTQWRWMYSRPTSSGPQDRSHRGNTNQIKLLNILNSSIYPLQNATSQISAHRFSKSPGHRCSSLTGGGYRTSFHGVYSAFNTWDSHLPGRCRDANSGHLPRFEKGESVLVQL